MAQACPTNDVCPVTRNYVNEPEKQQGHNDMNIWNMSCLRIAAIPSQHPSCCQLRHDRSDPRIQPKISPRWRKTATNCMGSTQNMDDQYDNQNRKKHILWHKPFCQSRPSNRTGSPRRSSQHLGWSSLASRRLAKNTILFWTYYRNIVMMLGILWL